jgi:hypothetical protein
MVARVAEQRHIDGQRIGAEFAGVFVDDDVVADKRVLATVDRKPPLSSYGLYFPRVPDWRQDEVTSCQRHATGLMARLRDGQITTHFGPVFAMKAPSIPS